MEYVIVPTKPEEPNVVDLIKVGMEVVGNITKNVSTIVNITKNDDMTYSIVLSNGEIYTSNGIYHTNEDNKIHISIMAESASLIKRGE